jgi:hypothetical protein
LKRFPTPQLDPEKWGLFTSVSPTLHSRSSTPSFFERKLFSSKALQDLADMAYSIGETYICSAEVKDAKGAYVDPSSITCEILKPDRTQAVLGNMIKDAVGKYHYDYDIGFAITGAWKARVKAVIGLRTAIEEISFSVS